MLTRADKRKPKVVVAKTRSELSHELLDIYHCNGRIQIWPKDDVEYFIHRAVELAELTLHLLGEKYE